MFLIAPRFSVGLQAMVVHETRTVAGIICIVMLPASSASFFAIAGTCPTWNGCAAALQAEIDAFRTMPGRFLQSSE